ncbi:MAG: GspE/PulE family protein [bacterium]
MDYIDTLVEKKFISSQIAKEARALAVSKFDGNIDAALLDMGIPSSSIRDAKSAFFAIPVKSVSPKDVGADLLKYIPEDAANHYMFIPIGYKDDVLEVGVVNPEDSSAMNALQFISVKSNIPYKQFVISREDFEAVLGNYKNTTGEVDQALSQMDTELETANADISNSDSHEELKDKQEDKIVEDAPIIKIVAVILRHAIEGDASDIHIENNGDKVNVRFRVDGTLHTSLVLPMNTYNGIVARIKILARLRLDEKRKPQDGSFSSKIDGRKIDFRVSTMPTSYGEKVVMRILDSEKGLKPLDQLGLSPHNLELVKKALELPYGLILITGPTGSGKTTTLYSMLASLDRDGENIVSLEDPVEYNLPGVNQSQVMAEIGYTFASGLRSILRQDPDIILVGEIRDKETAQLAIQAALTGHLVLSTLHTNNAAGVVPRLIDMGVDPYLIAPTLALAVGQRLVRATHPSSRKEVPTSEEVKGLYNKYFGDLTPEAKAQIPLKDTMIETVPSAECPSGTRGRIAVHEMFIVDKEMQTLIMKSPGEQEIMRVARKQGMITMKEDGFIKSLNGLLPMTEVYTLGQDDDSEEVVA